MGLAVFFNVSMNISIVKQAGAFRMSENGLPIRKSTAIEEIIEELKDRMRKYPYHKIWLSYQGVPVGIQEELDKMVRKHNLDVDFGMDR